MGNRFEELEEQLSYMFNPDERTILLNAMAKVGTYEELRRQLNETFNPDDRAILLNAMAKVSTFEELRRQLNDTFNTNDRAILLNAMANNSEELPEDKSKVIRKKEGVRTARLQRTSKPSAKNYDVFIAHASEDKDFVTPLALSLRKKGLEVWYDNFVFKLGDSLRREIDKGLAQSRYGVVILSHSFFNKHWPQKELDGLAAREQLGRKIILPIWRNINQEEIAAYSPTLADIIAAKSREGIEAITNKIIDTIST